MPTSAASSRVSRRSLAASVRAAVAVVVTALGLAAAVPASAGIVAPGETISVPSSAFAHPQGTVLATNAIPFTLQYAADADVPGAVNAIFENAVVRDDATGALSFVYDVVLDDGSLAGVGSSGSSLWAGGFASFLTDLSGLVAFQESATVARSADGAKVGILGDGGAPVLVVRTDATAYDANGTATFGAAERLILTGIGGETSEQLVSGEALINGAFQPTGAVSPIPLPPAVFTGMGVMAAMGVLRLGRRFA